MKRVKNVFFMFIFAVSMIALSSCVIIDDTHVHLFENGVCECGELESYYPELEKYEVTLVDGENVIYTFSILEGSLIPIVEDLQKEGQVFVGWYDGEVKWNFKKMPVHSDLELSAHFVDNKKYDIVYQLNGGEFEEEVETSYVSGIGLETLPAPVREHYTFLGWYKDGQLVESIANDKIGTITLTAKWEAITYEVSYELNGGLFYDGAKIPNHYEEAKGLDQLPIAYKEHYEFDGWTLDGKVVTSIDPETVGDVELSATWSPVAYDIKYNLDGGKLSEGAPTQYTIEEAIILPEPTKEGCEFLGWYQNGTLVKEIKKGSYGTVSLTASWEYLPVEVTIKEALELEDGRKVIITATVDQINIKWSDDYKNISVTLKDATGALYAYRLGTNVQRGDIIKVSGEMSTYNGARQLASGATAEILGRDENYEEPISIKEATSLVDTNYVVVKGTVVSVEEWSDKYQNMSVTITDGNDELYIFRLPLKVIVGDIIIVYGKMGTYKGERQISQGSDVTYIGHDESYDEPEEPENILPVTFEFGENGAASHKDGSNLGTSKTYEEGAYELNLTNMSKVFGSAYDAKGNSCIKLGTGSAVATLSFEVPEEVKQVVIKVAQYKANTTKIQVNGVDYTITTASNNGEYTSITVDTSTTKTVTFKTVSGGLRAMINSITYLGEGEVEPEEPTHEHTACPTCGLCTDPECTGTNEEKCQGHEVEKPNEPQKITIVEAIEIASAKEHNTFTEEKYIITGVITNIYNTTYGNMYISDGVNEIIIYGVYSADGETRYDAMETKPVVGDTVTLVGILGRYNDNKQMKNGWLTSHVAHEHIYENGSCTICGEDDPNYEVDNAESYNYEFSKSQFSATGQNVTLNGVNWKITTNGGYFGYDYNNEPSKGQQVGSGSKPAKSLVFEIGEFSQAISKITVKTSGGSKINAKLVIKVNGVQVGEEIKLTNTSTEYTVTLSTPVSGTITLEYTQTSSKAIYISSLVVDFAEGGETK